jgi:lipoprotein NlpI
MSVNLLRVASLAATLGLSITIHAGEIIKDRSPDGRFALQLSADQDQFELGLIDLGTHKELLSLNSLGSPYANHSSLLWSPDSKRVAYTEDSRRGGYTTVYQQKGNGFEEVKLPELPDCEAKHVQKVYEASLSAERWLNASTLLLLSRGGWTTEDGGDGECEESVTIAFDAKGKASIQNVKSTSARELVEREKARTLVQDGQTKSEAGDKKGAIADYTRAIKLDPKNPDAYGDRGNERQDAGDLNGAMADFNRAIEMNSHDPNPYYNRGVNYFLRRDWAKVIPDMQRHDELNDQDEDAPPLIWIAHVRLGKKEAADKELAKFIADHPDWEGTWNTKIDNFLLGKMSEQELLAATGAVEEQKQQEQQCEAWFYVGVKRLSSGDKVGAAEAFRKSIATNEKARNEYDFSKAELKEIGNP